MPRPAATLSRVPQANFRYTQKKGAVPKWPKGEVCKTSIRGFESHPRLQLIQRGCVFPIKFVSMSEPRDVIIRLARVCAFFEAA